jgi:methionine-rich copper-binding protein CopC
MFGKNNGLVSGKNFYVLFSIFTILFIGAFTNNAKAITELDTLTISDVAEFECPNSITVKGNRAYVGASCTNSIHVVDISNPSNLRHLDSATYANHSRTFSSLLSYDHKEILVNDNFAFITFSSGLLAFDISDPNKITKYSFYEYESSDGFSFSSVFNDIDLQNNYLYAVTDEELQILDVTDPTNVQKLGYIKDDSFGGAAANLDRISELVVKGNYAYLTVRGSSNYDCDSGFTVSDRGFTVLDISNPANIVQVAHVAIEDGIGHLKVDGNFAYLINEYGSEIVKYDISNPSNPVRITEVDIAGIYDHHIGSSNSTIKNSKLYVTSSAYDSFSILDNSTVDKFELFGIIRDDSIGGNASHLDGAGAVAVSDSAAFVVSRRDNSISAFDLTEGADTVVDPPVVIQKTPEHGSLNVSVSTNLVIKFDKRIRKGSGKIYIGRDFASTTKSGLLDQVIDVRSNSVTVQGDTVTINPKKDLLLNTNIQVRIDSSAFEDLEGTAFDGIRPYEWQFKTEGDKIPPQVEFFSPDPGGVDYLGLSYTSFCGTRFDPGNKRSFSIFFDEPVLAGSGSLRMKNSADNSLILTLPVNSEEVSVGGFSLSINIDRDLSAYESVYIEVDAGAVKDHAGNDFAGVSNNYWNFVLDHDKLNDDDDHDGEVELRLSSKSPSGYSQSAALTEAFELTFNKKVEKGSGDIIIMDYENETVIETIPVSSDKVIARTDSSYGPSVIILHDEELPLNEEITVIVPATAFKDLDGNFFSGFEEGDWIFHSSGTRAPELNAINYNPGSGSENVDLSKGFEITFNHNIEVEGKDIIIRRKGETDFNGDNDGVILERIPANSDQVEIFNNFLTIKPNVDLSQEGVIRVEIDSETVKSTEGRFFTGTNSFYEAWEFSPGLYPSRAHLVSLSPPNGAKDVDLSQDFVITFNKPIEIGEGGDITISRIVDGSLVEEIDSQDSSRVTIIGNQVIIKSSLLIQREFGISISFGCEVFRAVGGDLFFGIGGAEWCFITSGTFDGDVDDDRDQTAPIIVDLNPEKDSDYTDEVQNFQATFSETVVKGSGNIRIYRDDEAGTLLETIAVGSDKISVVGEILSIDPVFNFEDETKIFIEIDAGAVEDLAGNDFAGIANRDWKFTINSGEDTDDEAPLAVTFSPEKSATEVDLKKNLSVQFNEEVILGSGDIVIRDYITNNVLETISVNSTKVSTSEKTLIIDHDLDLAQDTKIYVTIAETAIKDQSDNYYEGISDKSWSFTGNTVDDSSLPEVISYSPAPGAKDVDLTKEFVINFDEEVEIDSGFITIRDLSNDGIIAEMTLDSAGIIVSEDKVTIKTTADLSNVSGVYIQISEKAFKDKAGNYFVGISDKSWSFEATKTDDPDDGNNDNSGGGSFTNVSPLNINADDRTYTGKRKVSFSYSVTRAKADSGARCKVRYSGIKHKTQKFRFKKGKFFRFVNYRIGKKQLRKLRRSAAAVNIGINVSCSDGTSANETIQLNLN